MDSPAILFVDDEVGVLRSMKRLFRRGSYDVYTANSAEEGLELLQKQEVKVIVSDQRMAGTTGTEFLKKAQTICPNSIRVILSGYAEMHAVVAAINDGHVYRFVTKPWDDEELCDIIAECMARYDMEEAYRQRVGTLEDEQRDHQDVLRFKESLITLAREVLDKLPMGIAAIDKDLCVVYANDQLGAAMGDQPDIIPGQRLNGRWTALGEKIAAASAHEAPFSVELDGGRGSASVRITSIGGEAYALLATPLTFDSITQGDSP